MKLLYQIIFLTIIYLDVYAHLEQKVVNDSINIKSKPDIERVNEINRLGYSSRLIDPEQTLAYAEKALKLGKEINYLDGIAEAYRIKGIAKYSINQNESAIENYLNALSYFKQNKNLHGEAKVYNNIGILYRDVDYDKSAEYFDQALKIALKLDIRDLTAGLYLNIGTLYQKKKSYNLALSYFEKSIELFRILKVPEGIVACLQNTGVTYFRLNQLDKAAKYLQEAVKKAKENDLNVVIASTNLTLTSIYIAKGQFEKAEQTVQEGVALARLLKDTKLQYDYLYTSYELEFKRKNYQQALNYLQQVYKQDSSSYKNNVSDKIGLLEEQYKQREKQRATELTMLARKNDRIMFWASTIVAVLLMVMILLLIRNNRKTAKGNRELTRLNLEVSFQKENLDRINHHLEEIIDDRTKDLQIKNQKLSEYSSHLSHQIRGPIATLKGLMILENDQLIDQTECLALIQDCVNEIDEKIIQINDTLHDINKNAFNEPKKT